MSLTAALLLSLLGQYGADTLGAVRFDGNRSFSSRVLAGVVMARARKPFAEATLERDVGALERYYQDQGFFEVQAHKSVGQGRRPAVTFTLNEGPRTRIGVVVFTGNRGFGSERLLRLLEARPGRAATRQSIDASARALKVFYLNNGYPFVGVSANLLHGQSDSSAEQGAVTYAADTLATLVLEIDEGPRCRVDSIAVRGNRVVRTGTILRALELRPGELYSQQRLYRAQTRLYATKLFSRVAFIVLPRDSAMQDSSVTVRFDLAEQAHRSVAFGIGVETPTNRLLLSTEWEHDNVLNRGQVVTAAVEYFPALSGEFRVATQATYRVPYLLLTRVDFQTRPFFSYERFDTARQREYGLETGMSRSLVPQFTVGISNRLRFISDTAGITNSLGLSGQYDTRDDVFEPRQGLSAQVVAEVAGGWLQGRNDLYRLTGDVRVYQHLGLGFITALRGMAGKVTPYGRSSAVPYYESFTLGGRSSMRGFPDRSLGPDSAIIGRYGTAVANANAELRSPYLFGWVGLVGFADIGNVSREFSDFVLEYCAGAGIRVRTPIGPVRLDWGKRLRNPEPGDRGRFYLGLLHAF